MRRSTSGSGTGSFSRLLARRSDHVLGLDLSPEMVRVARERSASLANVEYRRADFLAEPLPEASFDAIVSLATLHHVALGPALRRISSLLAPGGTLLVLDLYQARTLGDRGVQGIALLANAAFRLAKYGRLRQPAETRAAWAEHGERDVYPTLDEVRASASSILPGSRVRRHLFWRYSLAWHKPA